MFTVNHGIETREHLIIACTYLSEIRHPFLEELFNLLDSLNVFYQRDAIFCMQLLMDCTHSIIPDEISQNNRMHLQELNLLAPLGAK